MKNRVFFATVTAVAVTVNPCTGEDRDRPTRTASDGSQVVDYIAELESDVDSLKRQVTALENELSHKNDLLAQSGGSARQPVVAQQNRSDELSKDLSEARSRLAEQSERIQAQYARLTEQTKKISELTEAVESQKKVTTHPESQDRSLKEKLEERIKASQSQEAKLRQVEAERLGLTARLAEASVREKDLQTKLSQLEERRQGEQVARARENEQRLTRAQADLNATIESQKTLLVRRDTYVRELEERLKQQTEALNAQRTKLNEAESQRGSLEVQLLTASAREQELIGRMTELGAAVAQEQKRDKLEKVGQERAELSGRDGATASSSMQRAREEESKKNQQVASIAPSTTQDAQLRAVVPSDKLGQRGSNAIVGGVRGELNAVRAQFSQRDKLFAEYKSSKPALIVNPAKAVSRRGETLSDLETALMNATNPRDASRIKQSLEEIKRALDEDIKLIQRLNRK